MEFCIGNIDMGFKRAEGPSLADVSMYVGILKPLYSAHSVYRMREMCECTDTKYGDLEAISIDSYTFTVSPMRAEYKGRSTKKVKDKNNSNERLDTCFLSRVTPFIEACNFPEFCRFAGRNASFRRDVRCADSGLRLDSAEKKVHIHEKEVMHEPMDEAKLKPAYLRFSLVVQSITLL